MTTTSHARGRRLFRRGQTGQSILILAVVFMALVAFVGIVTDVSLLFVRYSTLRRAVDASAVAAATQMRRIEDTAVDNPDVDTGSSSGYAAMSLAARQFLEMYGLSPENVLVETCQAQMVRRIVDENDVEIFEPVLDENGAVLYTAEQAAERYYEVCRSGLKLVRVEATIVSPTVFLRLLGMEDVTLLVKAVSQTAVLDVVLVLDVSESMARTTRYCDYSGVETSLNPNSALGDPDGCNPSNRDRAVRFLPGRAPIRFNEGLEVTGNWWDEMYTRTHDELNQYIQDNPSINLQISSNPNESYMNTYQLMWRAFIPNNANTGNGGEVVTDPSDPRLPRTDCRPRFYPLAHLKTVNSLNQVWEIEEWRRFFFNNQTGSMAERDYFNIPTGNADYNPEGANESYYRYAGWAAQYSFYGCCNDPNGDGNFDDLVCQPFRAARDSSDRFLTRIDFPRGDGVALVTYGRAAEIIYPNGRPVPGDTAGNLHRTPWIRDEAFARRVLNEAVGVNAERSFYYNNDMGYDEHLNPTPWRWDGFVNGSSDHNFNYWNTTPMSALTLHPVTGACPMDMAMLYEPYSPYDLGETNEPLLMGISQPTWLRGMIQNTLGYGGNTLNFTVSNRTYEHRGSCRNGNVGGALAAAGTAFNELDPGRREGSVWVMVMLGDGAAGATDPMTRNYAGVSETNVFAFHDGTNRPIRSTSQMGEYGSYGACPYGVLAAQKELVRDNYPPFCSDIHPETRNLCATTDGGRIAQHGYNSPLDLDLNNHPLCEASYDADDYARDWADYVAGVTRSNSANTQFPIMFTIGFGLTYQDPTGNLRLSYRDSANVLRTCSPTDDMCIRKNANPEDYLGEELLRYIADAGDNFRIDDDYWQYWLATNNVYGPNLNSLTPQQLELFYGQPGPCRDENATDPSQYAPMPRREDCGNYFNAPHQARLEEVFNEIASRMFTRLSR